MTGDGGVTEEWVGSGRIGGGRSMWVPERSHILLPHVLHPTPTQKCHHTPSATISTPPPQEPEEAAPEASIPVVGEVELALEVPTSAVSQALEVAIPAHMAPLHLKLGGIKRVYKCWMEGCSKGPSTSCATICARVCRDHLGVRLVCPSCTKTFLNLDALRHHRKIHSD